MRVPMKSFLWPGGDVKVSNLKFCCGLGATRRFPSELYFWLEGNVKVRSLFVARRLREGFPIEGLLWPGGSMKLSN